MNFRKISTKNMSAYLICAVMITALTAPVLSISLQTNIVSLFSNSGNLEMDSQVDYEPLDSYFEPTQYDVADYSREDIELNNRSMDSDNLLFGSVDSQSAEANVPPPADMTFSEDNTKVYINADGVNMRQYPSLENSAIINKYSLATELVRTGVGNGWTRVVNSDGLTGYIKSDFITDSKPQPKPTPTPKPKAKTTVVKSSSPAVANSLGEAIALEAQKYLGVRYRGGYADPSTGFDCTGLSWYVYNRYGISTPRSSGSYYNAGTVIPYSEIAPGDVISWDTRKYDKRTTITHVSIYIGGGMMVHASSSNRVVTKVSVAQYSAWGCKMISVHRFNK